MIRQITKFKFDTEAVEASQKWVCNLHFWLYLGQFLTNFQNSFFLWKLLKITIWLESGCAITHPAHPLPPPLVSLKIPLCQYNLFSFSFHDLGPPFSYRHKKITDLWMIMDVDYYILYDSDPIKLCTFAIFENSMLNRSSTTKPI